MRRSFASVIRGSRSVSRLLSYSNQIRTQKYRNDIIRKSSAIYQRTYFTSNRLSASKERSRDDHVEGLLSFDQYCKQVEKGDIETFIIGFTDMQGRLLGKRYDASYVARKGTKFDSRACNYLLTIDMDMNTLDGFKAASWSQGYGDFGLRPDWGTLRRADWLDKTAIVLCDVIDIKTHELLPHAPRSILKNQIQRANKLGFGADCASELEYYIYNTPYWEAAEKGYAKLEPAGWYLEDYHVQQGTRNEDYNARVRRHLKRSGVPVESSKGEYGLGQHELNVEFSDILTMADRHVIYKQCLREVADNMGQSVTFMAKPHADQSGSSCHIHLNLTNEKKGGNSFSQDHSIFEHYLGGYLTHIRDVVPFLAPTINSYKRFRPGSWAPTKLAWSNDNRSAGFRVIGDKGDKALRIECRIPGADVNPYLAFSGCLAAGLEGVQHRIEPAAEFRGDAYNAKELKEVPRTLYDANQIFKTSSFVKNAFGEDVVDHYSHYFQLEVESWNRAVTDWETKRYFDQI